MYQHFHYSNYAPELGELVTAGFNPFNDWWNTHVPEHKKELERKILHSYWFNQIGAESPERFKFYLNAELERIMPYYNQLYASELINFNPLLNHYISMEGRTVENLVREANSENSNVGKVIRDFISSAENRGQTQGNIKMAGSKNVDFTEDKQYNKDGTEHETGERDSTKTEAKDTTENVTEKSGKTTAGHVTDNGTENTVNGGQNVTTNDLENTKTGTETKTETGTVKKEGAGTENITKDETGSTTDHTEGKSDKTTDTTDTTNSSGTNKFSDTPQKLIDGDKMSIRLDYLTTYTATTDNNTHTGKVVEGTTYSEDKTGSSTGKETTGKTSSDTGTDTFDKTYGTETEETERKTGDVTEKFGGTKDVTSSNDKETNMREDTDSTTNTVGHSDTTTTEKETAQKDGNWDEKGNEHTTGNDKTIYGEDTLNTGSSSSFKSEQNNDTATTSNATAEEEKEKKSTDRGERTRTEGYYNVSASQLLKAFRETFLNIDNDIIKQLEDNFMRVF